MRLLPEMHELYKSKLYIVKKIMAESSRDLALVWTHIFLTSENIFMHFTSERDLIVVKIFEFFCWKLFIVLEPELRKWYLR